MPESAPVPVSVTLISATVPAKPALGSTLKLRFLVAWGASVPTYWVRLPPLKETFSGRFRVTMTSFRLSLPSVA